MPIAEVQAGSGGGEFRATQLMKNRSGFVWTIREVSFYLSRTHARLSNPESTGPVQALVLKGFLGTRGKRVIGGRSAYRQIRSTLTDEFHRLRTLYDAPAIRNLRGPQGDHSPDPTAMLPVRRHSNRRSVDGGKRRFSQNGAYADTRNPFGGLEFPSWCVELFFDGLHDRQDTQFYFR